MSRTLRTSVGMWVLATASLFMVEGTRGQTPKPAAPAAAPATPAAVPPLAPAAPATAAKSDEVLGTVYDAPIQRSEVQRVLSTFGFPEGAEEQAYQEAMKMLVNTRLLARFLQEQKVVVPSSEIDQMLDQYEKSARANGTSLAAELAANETTLDEFRDRMNRLFQWNQYVMPRATDEALKAYADKQKDLFNGTRVRASHILIMLDPDATEAQKQAAREKLATIKSQITSGSISFADAANKYSEDPGNVRTPSGGDLDFFTRNQFPIESFSAAAFALKPGEISEPVESDYGFHLIQVTERRDGDPYVFDQIKSSILDRFATEMQQTIVDAERAKAEAARAIQIKPIPADLIPTLPAGAATPATEATTPAPVAPADTPKAP